MIVWAHVVLGVLHACVLYFLFICTSSAQLSVFHMERSSRNALIILIIFQCAPKLSKKQTTGSALHLLPLNHSVPFGFVVCLFVFVLFFCLLFMSVR